MMRLLRTCFQLTASPCTKTWSSEAGDGLGRCSSQFRDWVIVDDVVVAALTEFQNVFHWSVCPLISIKASLAESLPFGFGVYSMDGMVPSWCVCIWVLRSVTI